MPLISWDDYEPTDAAEAGDDGANQSNGVAATKALIESVAAQPVKGKPPAEKVESAGAPDEPRAPVANGSSPEAQPVLAEAEAAVDALDVTESEEVDFGAARVGIDDKQMINCRADLNQVVPIKYQWAWQAYLQAAEAHWSVRAINLRHDAAFCLADNPDLEPYSHTLQLWLGYLLYLGCDAVTARALGTYRLITNPESRQYLLKQIEEDKIHMHAGAHLAEALGFDGGQCYSAFLSNSAFRRFVAWSGARTNVLADPAFTSGEVETNQALVAALYSHYLLSKSVATAPWLDSIEQSLSGRLVGCLDTQRHIRADQARQRTFMTNVINQIKLENPAIWTADFQMLLAQRTLESVLLSQEITRAVVAPSGLPINDLRLHAQWMGNRALNDIGLPEAYPGLQSPFRRAS